MTNELKLFLEAVKPEQIINESSRVFLFTRKSSVKARTNLMKTGFFDGNEKVMRLTITKDRYGDWDENTYTVLLDDNKSYSWHSGTSGHTCVSENMHNRAKLLHTAKRELYGDLKK